MGNDPTLEIVAKERSELTDRIAKELIRNFGRYNSSEYMRLVDMQDPHWDGYRELMVWTPEGERKVVAKAYGRQRIPAKLLDVDLERYNHVMGKMRFASVHVSTDFHPDEPSISPEFPYTIAGFLMDPVVDDVEGIARVASGPPLEVIKLDRLRLTPQEQDQFRIVPYWEGPAQVDFNHFKYDAFKGLGINGLTQALLYANNHG